MTEEIRKAFMTMHKAKLFRDGLHPLDIANEDEVDENGKYIWSAASDGFEYFEAGMNHQQKRINQLTTALKEIKKATGGSSSDGVYEMDAQLGAIWSKADEVLKDQNND